MPLCLAAKHSAFDALILHRCLQRHVISRLPDVEGDKLKKQKFTTYPIGYFHVDIAEVQTEDGKLFMFVAVDRTSKFAYAESATRMNAKDFLDHLTKAVPYKIHTILTDNGIQFAKREGTEAYWSIPFDRLCQTLGIGHRLTKVNHPWTNGQVERMNRTIKDATVKRYYYQSHDHLIRHLHTFLMAYNFAKRVKTLQGLTPYEYSCKIGTKEPDRFKVNPFQHNVGRNT